MTLENIIEVEKEIERFQKRIAAVKERVKKKEEYIYVFQGCKETGALKRGAMDLKNELTKLTK